MYDKNVYRNYVNHPDLKKFNVTVQETDLQVQADLYLNKETHKAIVTHRETIEKYILLHPEFAHTLAPISYDRQAPSIIKEMISSSTAAGVGPMACVAGVIAEYVGRDLSQDTHQVIVENGGDVFMIIANPVTIGIFSGTSPLNMRMGIKLSPSKQGVSVCTSAGTFGHSLSLGKSDAVCVVSPSGSLADAAATAIGNVVKSETDIDSAMECGKGIPGLNGIVIVKNDKAGFWGDIEIVGL